MHDLHKEDDDDDYPLQSKQKDKKRKKTSFSAYYNFYFELCKRLKQKMRENRKNFKFRKIYNRSKSAPKAQNTKPKVTGKTSKTKIVKRKVGRPAKSQQPRKQSVPKTTTPKPTKPIERKSKPAVQPAPKAPKVIDQEVLNFDTDYGGESDSED